MASEDLAVGDQRFDVVVDPVGGRLRTDTLRVMAPMGRMLLVGNASGDWEHTVQTNALWGGNLAMLGFAVGMCLPAHPEQARPAAEAALKAVGQGLADMRTETMRLAEAGQAHRRLERGTVNGQILLTPLP
ncbi:zinc-binding dehydrogenase [Saccharopolyspora sp. K220]|uniref:zinc-binding dehydrogenase n=1 Tax=Saccharopolyspora soli TaxID=2926618 RepID=UPI001F59BEC9|nr:zinc-binding dehydrogenase [Saccharopolyspora soli]MCI2421377.1 zinc-binding dehydrogenase [Saccharopolyspora soli]